MNSNLISHLSLPTSAVRAYSIEVELKLCPKCKRPFLAEKDFCPHCPEPYTWNQESYANLGCLLLMFLPLVLMVMFWIFFFMGMFFR